MAELKLSFYTHPAPKSIPRLIIPLSNGLVLQQLWPGSPLPDGVVSEGLLRIVAYRVVTSKVLVCEAQRNVDSNISTVKVVIKLNTDEEHLQAEAEAYKEWEQFQGSTIPRFHGLFETDNIYCILLEYCGEIASDRFEDEKANDRIISALKTMHKAGFKHGNIQAHNILALNNRITFISLKQATKCGRCPNDQTSLDLASRLEYSPRSDKICAELFNICTCMEFYRPLPIKVGEHTFSCLVRSEYAQPFIPLLEKCEAYMDRDTLEANSLLRNFFRRAAYAIQAEGVDVEDIKADLSENAKLSTIEYRGATHLGKFPLQKIVDKLVKYIPHPENFHSWVIAARLEIMKRDLDNDPDNLENALHWWRQAHRIPEDVVLEIEWPSDAVL